MMSVAKLDWWSGAAPLPGAKMKQPRLAVLHHAMNKTPRPTNPRESIAFGYMSHNKFHDREPQALLNVIRGLCPDFFDGYPRKPGTKTGDAFWRAVIGEAAQEFYRYGESGYSTR